MEYPDGIVEREALNADLEVEVPAWDFSTEPDLSDFIDIGWRREGAPFNSVQRVEFKPPIAPGSKMLSVPLMFLIHGAYALSYTIARGGNATESLVKRVTIDTLPPNDNQQPQAARFPDDLLGVITDEYLKEHGEVLISLPLYIGMRAFDRADFYWVDRDPMPGDTPPIGNQRFTQDDIDNQRLILTLKEVDVRAAGAGRHFLFYRLYDLAGNESPLSYPAPIQVDLVPAPENLSAPHIPLSARGRIDRQHAREGATTQGGVTLEIGRYDNAESSHFIVVDWNGRELPEVAVEPSAFPMQIYVPWRELTASGLGPGTAQVSYRIRYGGSLTAPSPVASAAFNFTVAGQDHANAPALLNTNLATVEVRGERSNLANMLTAQDEGLDARVLLTLFEDPQQGEWLEVFWGAVTEPASRYQVQPGDMAGKPLELRVPWAIIEQDKNNAALPVSYITDNGVNQQLAPATAVQVVIVPIEGLQAPDFTHADKQGYLNCCTTPRIWEGVIIRVEGNPAFAAGDTVEVHWQGYDDLGSTEPIDGTQWSEVRVLTGTEAINGFEFVVPYLVHIEPMVNKGSATAYYTLIKADGGYGSSRRQQVYIDRTLPSNEVCGPDNDLCIERQSGF